MSCEPWQDAISAVVDGEDPLVDLRLLDAHLARCAPCRQYRTFAEQSRSRTLVQPAADMPDLSHRVVKLNAVADRLSRWGAARLMLAVVAIQIIAFALPALVLGEEQNTSAHAARHLGAFSVAYGVGLLVVVFRPARARTVLPVAAVLAGALLITAVIDMASGHVPLLGETGHIPELISVVLIWLLAVPSSERSRRQTLPSKGFAKLRVVSDDANQDGKRVG